MRKRRAFGVALFLLCVSPLLHSQARRITAAEAKNHVGENAVVCGHVASTRFAERSRGQPTFLNLDRPHPKQVFTIVIWGSERAKFGTPEIAYRDRNLCVTGIITGYRGVPEIAAKDPDQIELEK